MAVGADLNIFKMILIQNDAGHHQKRGETPAGLLQIIGIVIGDTQMTAFSLQLFGSDLFAIKFVGDG